MTTLTSLEVVVTGGVDTHQHLHVAAALDQLGRVLGTESFPTTIGGYRQLLAWLRGYGQLDKVGVEGTGSYGAALARYLTGDGRRGARGGPPEPAGSAPLGQDRCRRRDRRRPSGAAR